MWKFVFAALVLASFPAQAGFEVKGVEKNCVTAGEGEACYHVFAGDTLRIAYTPDEAVKKPCAQLQAELRQIAARLEAPVPAAVTPAKADFCAAQEFAVSVPADVKNETEFRVVFLGSDGAEGVEAGQVSFKAYPRTLLDDVKSWADYKDNALVVRDKEGRLTEMLDRQKVNYVTREPVPASARKLTIVTGKDAEAVDGDAIYLREKVETFPAVRIVQTQQGKTVTVEMKLVDALAADEPLAQKMFAEIFKEIAK